MNYDRLKISTSKAESIANELYNIDGSASLLPGELDFNFRIKVKNGEGYILKISRPNEDEQYLDFQQEMLLYIEKFGKNIIAPRVIVDNEGNAVSEIKDEIDNVRKVRLLSWVSGRVWSSVNPQLDNLRLSLGAQCGLLTLALSGFDHPKSHREFEWDLAQSLWTKNHIQLFDKEEKSIISFFQSKFDSSQVAYSKLRKSVVHNDANDNNVIVSADLIDPKVEAAIDYGDAINTQVINDLAIACAYAIMNHNDPLAATLPLVKGYHSSFPLEEKELSHLYVAIAMRLIITITKSALNKVDEPDNEYLLISEKPAWEVLKKWYAVDENLALYSFRNVCEYTAHPKEVEFKKWANGQNFAIKDLFPTLAKHLIYPIDLSVSSSFIGHQKESENLALFQFKIEELQKKQPAKLIAGGYLEPRSIYSSDAYGKVGNSGKESRTIHLGIDFWLPAHTPVYAMFDGEVVAAVHDEGDKEYGGLLILKHQADNFYFFTLYGHNTIASVLKHKVGDQVRKGSKLTELGNYPENGNWAPHLHFQIMLSMLDYKLDFPGVAYFSQLEVFKSICPSPNLLFNLDGLSTTKEISNKSLISFRKTYLGKSLSLQYDVPIKMVRGNGQYLIDQYGRKFLDTVNNVAHVGHEHPSVVKAGQDQMGLINTNSRYLHDNINELTKELIETLPPELSVLHFVNSGSEANELAIRMVKASTGQRDIIASEVGYHGNSNMCIDISSYKFDGKGGKGAPEFTHIFPLPDAFRGKYRGSGAGEKYATEVQKQIEEIRSKGRNVGAFIIEPIISCGGQIELPDGFLEKAYKYVRAAGGLCISDEVQVGCGRVGKTFWGFQLHNVVPDIITIGKPLGNGHPLAAVACTPEVANKFANGMEYFNTFGGNPVSCAIGAEVIKTVKREKLREKASEIGGFLKSELNKMAAEFDIIGDVRGEGFFLGIELVDSSLNPLAKQTAYLANRMKDHGILMSIDGPDHNVLKIKPPMVFTIENTRELIFYLRRILLEDFMTII